MKKIIEKLKSQGYKGFWIPLISKEVHDIVYDEVLELGFGVCYDNWEENCSIRVDFVHNDLDFIHREPSYCLKMICEDEIIMEKGE